MAEVANHPRRADRAASRWTLVLAVALALRVVAAVLVTRYAEAKGKPCVFGDTAIYWELARAIASGDPYLVMQWGVPHFALRTPGYPLFLAACRRLFGPNLLAVRLVQAALGTLAVWLVARLARSVLLPNIPHPGPLPEREGGRPWIPLSAATIAAVAPYVVATSALVLSEATFVPLMLLGLWGLAALWRREAPRRPVLIAVGTGLAMGLAILSRPSWALFLPGVLTCWVIGSGRGARKRALVGSMVVALATAAVLAPWWVRNARVFGRFVPTALWVGASLYDGIGPQASGESDMAFVEAPDVRSLGESEQDAVFLDRATSFAKAHPDRVFELAVVKFERFWSPWPNAGTLRAPGVAPASALVTIPVLALIAIGAWDRRRDFRALVLLAGPLVYFCVLHLIFVSSIRYRIPGEVPAFGLAAVGLARVLGWGRSRRRARSDDGESARVVGRRVRKVVGWGTFLVASILVGGTISAYFYVTDSETLADLIRREAPKYLPDCRVDVFKARIRPFFGEVMLSQVQVRETVGDSPGPMVASSARVTVRFDPWAMLKGRFEARDVTVAGPTIRLRRKPDGSWNVEGLLADPWPGPSGGATPPISIQKGTVELAEEGAETPLVLLRDVSIAIPASKGPSAPIPFELTARGEDGLFDRLNLEGTIDPATGRLTLADGELVRLSLSEDRRDNLPAPVRGWLALAGLAGGEVDVDLPSLSFDPRANPPLRYRASARLRQGIWKCPKLPFPVSDVAVKLEAVDGELTILDARGSDGPTGLSLTGRARLDPDDLARSTFRVVAEATNLELDGRLRSWTPRETREIWDAYFPDVAASPSASAGRVDVKAAVTRDDPRAELGMVVDVNCLDVSMRYKHFAYPVDHVKGTIHCTKTTMDVDVHALINGKPLKVHGPVLNPGPNAVAALTFEVDSLPIDDALFRALPPEVKPVLAAFQPTGTVKGLAKLKRLPPLSQQADPIGRVSFDAWIDLNPGCSVTWEGLEYPVRNLTGQLEIHPDRWTFRGMKGNNGQATITAAGQVEKVNPDKPKGMADAFKVDLKLQARNLPFDQQLRDALPTPWKVTWETLNPAGVSDIDATISVDPRKPKAERDHYRVVVAPRSGTSVKLRFKPLVGEGAPPVPKVELPMDDVRGTFVYDTAATPNTSMEDVGFSFQRAPVTFARGRVDVKDSGQFELAVGGLEVEGLRLDEDLRKYMPPVMAQFSRRLDDLKIAKIKTNLGLSWSGRANESAHCRWDDAKVILYRNKVSIGADVGLGNIEGQIEALRGSFDGRNLDVHGQINLASVFLFDQQVSDLTARLEVENGFARLEEIHGNFLRGTIDAQLRASLEASPDYSTRVQIHHADLQAYALTQPGHQGFKGLVDAWVELSGLGYEPRTINGTGRAQIVQGDLGTLPVALRLFNVLGPAGLSSKKETKTAFDSAEVAFRVYNGETTLKPVRLVGNAFTLNGDGTLDVRGEIDLRLGILPLRDSLKIPWISDLTRGLSGQILVVRVQGPIASPAIKAEPIPGPGEVLKNVKHQREINRTGLYGPWRTGLESRLKAGFTGRRSAPEGER